jgi:hypothetical protein
MDKGPYTNNHLLRYLARPSVDFDGVVYWIRS